MRTQIKDAQIGKEVKLNGWLHEIRDLAKVKFLLLRDRTGIIQCVVAKENEEFFKLVPKLKPEMTVEIKGKVVENKIARLGYEVLVDSIKILGEVLQVLPIQVVEKGEINTDLSTRLDYRFLDLRKPMNLDIFKIKNDIFHTTVEFFERNGFMNVNTPKLTSAGVESGADMFEVKYFDKKAYLSQSPQIYKQMMVCSGFEKVFEIAPVFRAEKSNTIRHQTEFTGIDFEMGFINDEEDIMDVVENYLKEMVANLNKNCSDILKEYKVDIKIPGKIPRINMNELKQLLKEKGKELNEDDDFDPEAEIMVGEIISHKYRSDFVFVTDYPWSKRPFYHMKRGEGTRSFDLLFRGVEIATGAQREHRYDILKKQAEEKEINLEEMKDYAILFRCGAPPHGGCGLGLDRITQRVLNLENIREAILLPRDPERLTP